MNVKNVDVRKDGNAQIRITVNGVRKTKYVPAPTAKLSDRQFEKYLESERTKFEMECRSDKTTPQNFSILADMWLETMTVGVLRETSRRVYRGQLPRIKQAIGHIRIDRLTDYDIKVFVNSLSAGVVENNLAIISNVCKLGKSLGMIQVNPVETVKAPKRNRTAKSTYSRQEIVNLLQLLENHNNPQLRLFATLAAYSGMRTGEMLGLEWSDVDFKAHTLYIHQQLIGTDINSLHIHNGTKNGKNRTVSAPPLVFDMLLEWKQSQGNECKAGMVFGENGGYMSKYRPRDWLKYFCKAHGLRYCSPHAFRHFVATTLLAESETPATVAEYLGDKISTIFTYYVHAETGAVKQASNTMDNALERSKMV
jgi:integrase